MIINADVIDGLKTLADGSVQCVVTSPPYWGLRDYGTATWEGGDEGCQHTFTREDSRLMLGSGGQMGKDCTSWTHRDATPPRVCKCGAKRIDAQLGLEPTPDEYVAKMVEVFRAVKRVLRDDGTLWLNMGDSYCSQGGERTSGSHDGEVGRGAAPGPRISVSGLKPKDLVGMPWRVAFALQADGWYLRSDIIWAKPNPMPESCTDRPTKAHEYLFLLTKRARYFWDQEAVREQDSGKGRVRHLCGENRNARTLGQREPSGNERAVAEPWQDTGHRNIRTVWTIPTQSYNEAHFATFPEKLVEPCVKAGTSEKGCCPECGAGRVRVVDREQLRRHRPNEYVKRPPLCGISIGKTIDQTIAGVEVRTIGWQPSCKCLNNGFVQGSTPMKHIRGDKFEPMPQVPCTVLDPFCGSGTVGVVALQLGREFVGIELSEEYCKLAERRIGGALKPSTYRSTGTGDGDTLFGE